MRRLKGEGKREMGRGRAGGWRWGDGWKRGGGGRGGGGGGGVFFFQAEDGIRVWGVPGVQTCALPIFFGVEIEPIESPQMTIRVKMVHSSRKKINIITGFANNLFASVPTTIKEYEPYRLHKAGNLPMLGISEEPIEIEIGRASCRERV